MSGVPLAGGPVPRDQVRIVSVPKLSGGRLTATLDSDSRGTVSLFAWTGSRVSGKATYTLPAGTTKVSVATDLSDRAASLANGYPLVGFEAASGGTDSEAARIR
jgi:hypothetical protein